jgi:DNA-binding transcriptional regulator YiaG
MAPMRPQEVKRLRRSLGLTASKCAALLGCHPVTLRRWEAGLKPISPMAARFLRLLAQRHREVPK